MSGTPSGVHDGKSQPKPVTLRRGRVLSVDPVKYTVRVADEGGSTYDGVQVMSAHAGANGQGTFVMPEVDSTALLCFSGLSRVPFILGFTSMPTALSESDNAEDPTDFRNNKPVLNEGDYATFGDGGSFLVVRKGGVVEIGSSQSARRWYLPLENAITDLCENYLLQHTGGALRWESRDSGDETATEMKIEVKEFSSADPVIDVRMGRIADEDDQSLADGAIGAAVVRFFVNNRYRLWIDRDGNFQNAVFGSSFTSYNKARKEYHHEGYFMEVRGVHQSRIGDRDTDVTQGDTLRVGRDMKVMVQGQRTVETVGQVRHVAGSVSEEVRGLVARTIHGTERVDRVGNMEDVAGGKRVLSTGEDATHLIGGTEETTVTNTEDREQAVGLTILRGNAKWYIRQGNARLGAGGTSLRELAVLELRPDGVLYIEVSGGTTKLEVNASGARLRTPGGAVELDAAGMTRLGPSAGQGRVITTTTHPVCFVTGLPILGSSSVSAGGVPTPGPALPSSGFVED